MNRCRPPRSASAPEQSNPLGCKKKKGPAHTESKRPDEGPVLAGNRMARNLPAGQKIEALLKVE